MKKLRLHLHHQGKLDELTSTGTFRSEGLLFAYDERRNSRAWQKLPRGEASVSAVNKYTPGSEVVLLGQFETSDYPSGGFGHSGAYPNELILLDILSNEPTAKRSKSR